MNINFSCGDFNSWEDFEIGTAPVPGQTWLGRAEVYGLAMLQNGSSSPWPLTCRIQSDGKMYLTNKSGAIAPGGWVFVSFAYACK